MPKSAPSPLPPQRKSPIVSAIQCAKNIGLACWQQQHFLGFDNVRHASRHITVHSVRLQWLRQPECHIVGLLSYDIMALNISLMFLLARIRVVVVVAVFLSVFRTSAQQGRPTKLIFISNSTDQGSTAAFHRCKNVFFQILLTFLRF